MKCWWIYSIPGWCHHWISMIQRLNSMDGAHRSQLSAGLIQIMTLAPWNCWRRGEEWTAKFKDQGRDCKINPPSPLTGRTRTIMRALLSATQDLFAVDADLFLNEVCTSLCECRTYGRRVFSVINRYKGILFATVLLSDRYLLTNGSLFVLPPSRFQGSTYQLEARHLHPAGSLHFRPANQPWADTLISRYCQ